MSSGFESVTVFLLSRKESPLVAAYDILIWRTVQNVSVSIVRELTVFHGNDAHSRVMRITRYARLSSKDKHDLLNGSRIR